jgi:cation:H+ antiporter
MATIMLVFILISALLCLIAGAELLVRGASRLAAAAAISPLVVGLTVVAYGTSMPEMVVSVMSGISGQPDIALGNVVGSNIFNVLFILGISALIAPLVVSWQLVRLDVPVMIAVSVVAFFFGVDGRIGPAEGSALLAGILAYTVFLIRQSRKDGLAPDTGGEASGKVRSVSSWVADLAFILGGLGLLILGGRWLVDVSVSLARAWGVGELVIGLTVVAAGTSLPEVATSIVATVRGERDIAVGNVVGSNIFNLLAVLGLSGLLTPGGIPVSPGALSFDMPVMVAVALACLPIFFTGGVIARWEGALFLAYYAAYTVYLVLAASDHETLPVFGSAMAWFVIPLTAVTLAIVTLREARRRKSRVVS